MGTFSPPPPSCEIVMSKLVLVPVVVLSLLLVFACTAGEQSDLPDDPGGAANYARTDSADAGHEQSQEPCPSPDGHAAAQASPGGEEPRGTPVVQSPEDALAADLALVAEARGWTIEEAEAQFRAAEIVGDIAGQVAAERPDIFVGSELSSKPGGAPALYIKGPADELVRALVVKAEIEIRIIDNQAFNFRELEQRSVEVNDALAAMGFRNIGTGFSLTGEIAAAVTREPGLPDDPAQILSGLPADLRDSVTVTVSDAPVGVFQSPGCDSASRGSGDFGPLAVIEEPGD